MTTSHKVFVSYSHEDAKWLNRLKKFLRPMERNAELQLWSDLSIQPSYNWHAEIQAAITGSDAAILLISQDFVASDYVASEELPRLLSAASERGLKIFPVFVAHSVLRNSSLLRFQGVNTPSAPLDSMEESEQNRVFVRLAESIDDLLKVVSAGITGDWLQSFRSRFVPIDGGTYVLGDDELYNQLHGLQEHMSQVDSFRIGKHVLTQSEWTAGGEHAALGKREERQIRKRYPCRLRKLV
jgi:hypothetical protein